jgi:2-C-methyl-D-erythritol 4-phosphate cytidylyltransferase
MTSAPHSNRCWAIIPAAGTGSRMLSSTPKQYLEVAGATVLEHSVAALLKCEFIEAVVIAVHRDDQIAAQLPGLKDTRVRVIEGGEQRSDSVLAGLQALDGLASPSDWVLVHDAARPCVLPEDIATLASAVNAIGVGGILAQPIVDTVKRADIEKQVVETVERDGLWCAQTPQMFKLGLLGGAMKNAKLNELSITDEASAMEFAGEEVQLIPGRSSNLKITVPEDLGLAEFYLAQQRADSST